MKMYGMELSEGSDIVNLTIPTGTAFPTGPDHPPTVGEMFYRTDSSTLHVYADAAWNTVAVGSTSGTPVSQEFTATASQTTFAVTGGYQVGNIMVFLNGVKLDASDYTATDGTNVVLATGATAGDTLAVEGYVDFAITDYYTKSEADAKYGILTVANEWTQTQAINDTQPQLTLKENDTTDQDFAIRVVSGTFYVTQFSDAGSGLYNPLRIDAAAGQLYIGSSSIQYGGSEIPRESRHNTFTAQQTFSAGVALNCNGGGGQQAYLPGDTKLYDYNISGIAYLTATQYGGGSSSVSLKLRTMNAGSANVIINAAYNAKEITLTSGNYYHDGEAQKTYCGRVNIDGTAGRLPSGWSSSKLGTGYYRVTHNLGTTTYVPMVTPYASATTGARIATIQNNYFDFYVFNGTTLTDSYSCIQVTWYGT